MQLWSHLKEGEGCWCSSGARWSPTGEYSSRTIRQIPFSFILGSSLLLSVWKLNLVVSFIGLGVSWRIRKACFLGVSGWAIEA